MIVHLRRILISETFEAAESTFRQTWLKVKPADSYWNWWVEQNDDEEGWIINHSDFQPGADIVENPVDRTLILRIEHQQKYLDVSSGRKVHASASPAGFWSSAFKSTYL
jgi:hypothetical protein